MGSVSGERSARGRWLRRPLASVLAALLGTTGFIAIGAAPAVGAGPVNSLTVNTAPAQPSPTAGAGKDVTLQWSVALGGPPGTPTCSLTRDGQPVPDPNDLSCSGIGTIAVSYDATLAGHYQLTLDDGDAEITPTVDVVPGAPTVTAPAPGTDPTPQFTFTTTYGGPSAKTTCTLADPDGTVIQTVTDTCASPFVADDLTASSSSGKPGNYTLTVVQSDDNETGNPGSAAYSYTAPVKPGQPGAGFTPAVGHTLTPALAIGNLDAEATPTCTLTDPDGNDITAVALSGCTASPTVDLSKDPNQSDGTYTLTVSQTGNVGGLVSDPATATYDLDTHVPATPKLTGPAGPSAASTPSYDITGIEAGLTPDCQVTGPTETVAVDCTGTDSGTGDPTAVLDLAGAANGTYTLTVSQTDAAGVSSGTATATYVYEPAAPAEPTLTGPSPNPGTARIVTFAVSGLDPEPLTPTCDVSGPSGSAPTIKTCTTSGVAVDLSGQPDGEYDATEYVTDGLNQESTTASASYTLDTSTPAPTISPAPGDATTGATPSKDTAPTFDIEDGESVSLPETYACTLTAPTGGVTHPACVAGNLQVAASAGDGHYTLEVDVTDHLGNTNSAVADYYLDATTPTPTVTRVDPAGATSNNTNPSFAVSDVDPLDGADTLSCEWSGGPAATPTDIVTNCTSGLPASGTLTSGDGAYTLTVTATDTSSQHNQASTVLGYTLDTMAFTPTFDTSSTPPSSSTSYSRVANPSVTVVGHDLVEGPDSFLCSVTVPGATAPPPTPCAGTVTVNPATEQASQQLSVNTGSGDGKYVLLVTAKDELGNVSPPAEFDYYYDASTPAPSIAPITPGAWTGQHTPANRTTPSFAIDYADPVSGPAALTCSWTGPVSDFTGTSLVPTVTVTTCPTPTANPGNPGVSDVYAFPTAGDGLYTLTVTGTDRAGNVNFATDQYWLRTAAPAPTVTVASGGSAAHPANGLNPTFTITDTDAVAGPDTFSCVWEVPGEASVPAGAPCAAGSVSFPATAGDGEYSLLVTGKDLLGNPSPVAEADYFLDTTALPPTFMPIATWVSTASAYTDAPNPTITINGEDSIEGPDTFACSLTVPGGTPPAPTPCNGPTSVSATGNFASQSLTISTGAGTGEYRLVVTATDQLGNVSQPAEFDYFYEASTPAPTVTPVSPGALTTATAPANLTQPSFAITDVDPISGPDHLTCVWTGPVAGFGGGSATSTVSVTTCPTPTADPAQPSVDDVYAFPTAADGKYVLTVAGQNAAGNIAVTTVSYWLHTVGTAPTITPSNPSVVTSQSKPGGVTSPSVVIADPDPIAGPDTLACSWTGPLIDGAGNVTTPTVSVTTCPTALPDPTNPSVADLYRFPTAADGKYVLTVTATDTTGNAAAATFAYWLDATTPAPVITPAAPVGITTRSSPANVAGPTFSISDAETPDGPDTYDCTWTGPVLDPSGASATPIVNVTTCPAPDGSGHYRFTTATNNGDGEYVLTVVAHDTLGNHAQSSIAYWYDSSTPAPTITLEPAGESTSQSAPSADTSPSFGITDVDPVSGPNALTCVWTGPVLDGAGHATTPTVDVTACPTPDGSGHYDFTTAPTHGDGEYTLTVTGTDGAGNSATSTLPYWVDVSTPAPVIAPVAPTIATTSASRSNVTSPTYAFSDGESPDGPDSYSCTWTGPVVDGTGAPSTPTITVTSCPTPDGSGHYSFSTAADGEYVLTVTAADTLGNQATTTVDYFLDATTFAPTIALTNPTSSPSRVRKPVFSLADAEQWSGPDTFTCTWVGPAPSTTVRSSGPCATGVQFDTTATGDGAYTLTVTATDTLGNNRTTTGAAASSTFTYVVDRSTPDPVIGLLSTPAVGSTSNATTPRFRITDSESVDGPDSFTCTWTGPPPSITPIATSCPAPTADPANPGVNDVYALPTSGLGDGSYTLTVTAQDTLGNTTDPSGATATATFAYTLDTATLAPVVSPGGLHSKNPSPAFTITEPVGPPTEATTPESYTCLWQAPDGTTLSNTTCTSGESFPTNGHGDGTYTLTVSAADALGNTHTATGAIAQTAVTYVLDRSTPAPLITLTSKSVNAPGHANPVSNVTAPTFSLADTEKMSLPVVLSCSWTGPGSTSITTDCSSGLAPGATATAGDGTYTLTVTGTDAAGNSATSSLGYDLDTTAPAVPTIAPSAVDINQRVQTFTVSGLEPTSTVSCSIGGLPSGAIVSPDCINGVVASNLGQPAGDGTYSLDLTVTLASTVPDGTYSLSVATADEAGNPSNGSAAGSYRLDTQKPAVPLVDIATASPSRTDTPLWEWQFGHDTTAEDLSDDTYSCTITGPNGWQAFGLACPQPLTAATSPELTGGDGAYLFTVTLTDPAGNTQSSSATYVYDHTSPAGPSILMLSPRSGAGQTRHPVWLVSGPSSATLTCELHRGLSGSDPVIAGPTNCSGHVSFDLTGMADGAYTVSVRAQDAAGNRSSSADSTYVLAPAAPTVDAPTSQASPAVWTVSGNSDDRWVCTLYRGSDVVDGPASCGHHPSYDMRPLASGRYTLSVVQVGPESVAGPAGTASWTWGGVPSSGGGQPSQSGGGTGSNPTGTAGGQDSGSSGGTKLPQPVARIIQRLTGTRPPPYAQSLSLPPREPEPAFSGFGSGIAKGLNNVVSTITSAGGGTGFPLLLLALVIAFLIAQNRIDRRDPKLAFASAVADDKVEFSPPPSRRDRS